jgi:hypothetical protein
MRILLLANNWVGWQALRWLKDQGEEIAGLVLHPRQRQMFSDEITRSAGDGNSTVDRRLSRLIAILSGSSKRGDHVGIG